MSLPQLDSTTLRPRSHSLAWNFIFCAILDGLKIEFELSVNDANVSILSRDSRQLIIAKLLAGGGVFKHARCSDSSNGTCIQVEVSDVMWPFDIELYVDLEK